MGALLNYAKDTKYKINKAEQKYTRIKMTIEQLQSEVEDIQSDAKKEYK